MASSAVETMGGSLAFAARSRGRRAPGNRFPAPRPAPTPATLAPGPASAASGHRFGQIRVERESGSGPRTLRRRRFPGSEDPIHAPLIERYRRETGTPGEAEGGPSAGEIKYSGALADYLRRSTRHGGPLGSAVWSNAVVRRHNAAERIFNQWQALLGGGGGLTETFINGVHITNNLVLGNAIPEPAVDHEVQGAVTRCWYRRGVDAEGRTTMDIYSQPPWSHVVNRQQVVAKFSSNASCTGGQGDATLRVRGRPDDAALESFIRLGEAEHDTDSRTVFFSHIDTYVANVNRRVGNNPDSRIEAPNLATCRARLSSDTRRDHLFRDFVLEKNRLTGIRHANNRHSINMRGIQINPGCTEVVYLVQSGTL